MNILNMDEGSITFESLCILQQKIFWQMFGVIGACLGGALRVGFVKCIKRMKGPTSFKYLKKSHHF